jgi:hypothetical protein
LKEKTVSEAPTFETASRCPKCDMPGEDVSTTPIKERGIRPGTVIHNIFCRNDQCKWYNTSWIVQVNPDGSIPTENFSLKSEVKKFQHASIDDEALRRQVIANIEKMHNVSQNGGGEIGGRR